MTLTGLKTWLGPVLMSLYRPAALVFEDKVFTDRAWRYRQGQVTEYKEILVAPGNFD